MNREELLYYARETIADTLDKATRAYGRTFPLPIIELGLRGRVAGRASYTTNRIQLNAQLFAENVDTFIARTIPHEVAHLVSFQLYGDEGRGHKARWKSVMVALGVKDITRCHTYKTTPARVVKRVTLYCDCRSRQASLVKVNRLKKNPHYYYCKLCHASLRFTLAKPPIKPIVLV